MTNKSQQCQRCSRKQLHADANQNTSWKNHHCPQLKLIQLNKTVDEIKILAWIILYNKLMSQIIKKVILEERQKKAFWKCFAFCHAHAISSGVEHAHLQSAACTQVQKCNV